MKLAAILRRKYLIVFLIVMVSIILTVTIGMDRLKWTKTQQFRELSFRQVTQDWVGVYPLLKVDSVNATPSNTTKTRTTLHDLKYNVIDKGTLPRLYNNIDKGTLPRPYNVIDKGTLPRPGVIPETGYEEKYVNISKLSPLDDFWKYPCLSGLPVFPEDKWSTDGKCVRTVNFMESGNKTTENCVPLRTPRGTTPICIYPAKNDIWVSGSIQKNGQWEGDLVGRLAHLLKTQPGLEFLDLGCNIGSYTVSIAHQGTKVTAVDPMIQNLELMSQSLTLGKLYENVTIIWNAVGNTHNIVKFKADINNVGGTRIEDFIFSKSKNTNIDLARTITLDDLLPLFKGKTIVIKMDIEETEYNALLGGQRFLDEVNIIAIQMEFMWHKKGRDGPKILEYLSLKGFRPYRDLSKRIYLNSSSMATWPGDIYFMKP